MAKTVNSLTVDDQIADAFVAGAAWWQFTANGSTMFGSEKCQAELEAKKRWPKAWQTEYAMQRPPREEIKKR